MTVIDNSSGLGFQESFDGALEALEGMDVRELPADEMTLDDRVREAFPAGKYHTIVPVKTNGQRRAGWDAQWGINGSSRPVRLKANRRLEGRAQEMRERGYDTENDATVLAQIPYDEALAHGVSPILDYVVKDGYVFTAEPKFNGVSLGEFFAKAQPNKREFNQVISGITKAVKFVHDRGYYHRDINWNNTMVGENGSELEVRLTDFEYSVPRDKVKDAPFTTVGTSTLRDPFLATQPYSDQSEIYQIAMNALKLFTGEVLSWSQNNELLDPEKRRAAIRRELSSMPREIRKRHGKWIEKALSTDPNDRFSSFDEFNDAVYDACRPGFWERVKRNAKTIGAVAGITGAVALGAGGLFYGHNQKMHAAQIAEASVPRVETHWNGRGMEMFNDQIRLDVDLNGYQGTDKDKHQWYPYDNQFLRVEPGQNLTFTAELSADIRKDNSTSCAYVSFPGKFYIEGKRFDNGKVSEDFIVYAENSDEAKRDYGEGYWNPSYRNFVVPSDLKPGVYIFATEVFAPTDEERTREYEWSNGRSSQVNSWHDAKIRFNHPGKAIARKRIPLVVGEPEVAAEVYDVGFKWRSEDWGARKIEGELKTYSYTVADRSANFFAEMPGTNYQRNLGEGYRCLGLPTLNGAGAEHDLYFVTRDSNGNIIGFTGAPLETRAAFTDEAVARGFVKQEYQWDFGEVDNGFADRLVKYRESLAERIDIPKPEEKK